MKILITGICGFAGSALAESFLNGNEATAVIGVDNLIRHGSETNRQRLRKLGVQFVHADIRCASDWDALPPADWVIDAAANPSVLAGVGATGASSRQLLEHNLVSMVHVLEYCKRYRAGLVVLSSSRVYSIPALTSLPLVSRDNTFDLDVSAPLPVGVSAQGIGSGFSTHAPVSLYGSTKLAGEVLALEYGEAFDFPVWVNRCGVLAGPGQFGTPEQGIFAFWVNAHLRRRPLRFIGFDGGGKQVRDALHPADLYSLITRQMQESRKSGKRIYTAGGGRANAMSLRQLHDWCDGRFGNAPVTSDLTPRPYDIPWVVMDNSDVARDFSWTPTIGIDENLKRISAHAERHPDWLEWSGL